MSSLIMGIKLLTRLCHVEREGNLIQLCCAHAGFTAVINFF